MLGDNEIKILESLNDAHNDIENVSGVNVNVLAEQLKLDVQTLALKYLIPLKNDYFIECFTNSHYKITQYGIDYFDDLTNDEEIPIQQQFIINPQNSPISQSGNATINITNNFLQELETSINKNPDLSDEEKKTWTKRIKELASNTILTSSVLDALDKIKDYL